jgi:predicted transcriptional regulator
MTETPSIRIDAVTTKRLDALYKRSKSFLAAEAITTDVDSEEWPIGEIQAGISELDAGKGVEHEKVSDWLKGWGKTREKMINDGKCRTV